MKTPIRARQAAAIFAVLLLSTTAHAVGLFRAYVASDGNDANPCTLAQPCRLLPAALAAVADGGGIWMLDSANYNTSTVNITKSVTILAIPGAVGSVLAIGGPAISVTTGGISVAVRNLVITQLPGGGGTDGISMVANSALAVENSVFENLSYSGVYAAGTGVVAVTESVFRGIQGYAIFLENGMRAQVAGTRMLQNTAGVHAKAAGAVITRATLTDCIISASVYAVHSYAENAGASAAISITRSTIANSGTALRAESVSTGAAEVIIGSSQVHKSGYRWQVLGGTAAVASYGNNQFLDYAASIGSLTLIGLE